MTGRACASLMCATAILAAGCAQSVSGVAVRAVPAIDEDSRSPVDVDSVLLDRAQMQAVTGAGADLTMIPGTDTKAPVDIEFLMETVVPQCQWVYAETRLFGDEIEEFHKNTYQHPPRGGLISQAAAGYRDAAAAQRAFDSVVEQIARCGDTGAGAAMVGEVSATPESIQTRPGACGRDYRVKSAVLVEVTFCAFPESVPDIVMTNIMANISG